MPALLRRTTSALASLHHCRAAAALRRSSGELSRLEATGVLVGRRLSAALSRAVAPVAEWLPGWLDFSRAENSGYLAAL